jgi:hypothetical protein
MAFYAAREDEVKAYQPMTYDAVTTPNPYRQGVIDPWNDA